MRINSLTLNSSNTKISKNNKSAGNIRYSKNDVISFSSSKSKIITNELARRGIRCNFHGHDFVAECVKNTVDTFEKLFGRKALPTAVLFEPLNSDLLGCFLPYEKEIVFNSNDSSFNNMEALKAAANDGYHFILPNDFSSLHPACTFVHEFSHCAHHNNIDEKTGAPLCIMEDLRKTQVYREINN